MPLDAPHALGQMAQHGSPIAGARANLEHPVGRLDLRRLRHERDDEGLGNGLGLGDGQGPVLIGLIDEFGIDEALARNLSEGLQDARIAYAARFDLFRNHTLA